VHPPTRTPILTLAGSRPPARGDALRCEVTGKSLEALRVCVQRVGAQDRDASGAKLSASTVE